MLSAREISNIKTLHSKKGRIESGLFTVEGVKTVDALIRSDYTIEKIYATEVWLSRNKRLTKSIEIIKVNETILERISTNKSPEQVLALAKIKHERLDTKTIADKVVLLLDGLNDPGNFGTIIRTADWFGVKKIICSKNTVDCYNPKVVQSAMGSLFSSTIYFENLEQIIPKLKQEGKYSMYATALHGSDVRKLRFAAKSGIIIGSESHGIQSSILKMCDQNISILSADASNAESLNAGVAAGIVLHCIQ